MNEQDQLHHKSTATNVQLHEIKPVAEGMTFGALLDKFYMNSELGKDMAKAEKNSEPKAQDFVDKVKKVAK